MTYRSHRQQLLMNYFDSKDIRTRENYVSIDGQLLNIAASGLDDAYLRYNRELKALQLPYCPTGIDNNGVYFSISLDPNYPIASDETQLNSLIGVRNRVNNTLTPYDDRLPVPAGYKLDTLRSAVKVANPLIKSFTGSGNDQSGNYRIFDETINQTIPIVNRLSFWLSNTYSTNLNIEVAIYGTKYPQNPWNIAATNQVEILTLNSEGYSESINPWVYIKNIVVRNLPNGAVLNGYSMNFSLPASPDQDRPISLAGFREQTFDCYWKVSETENLLQEVYNLDSLSGLVYHESFNLSSPINSVIAEPNTWGGLMGGGTTLFYFDRRPPMKGLNTTALTTAPIYGLDVYYDVSLPGNARNITIRPIVYNTSIVIAKYRFVITKPDNTLIVLNPDGSYLPYKGSSGWQVGYPTTITTPLVETGLYQISLQCQDGNNIITYDTFPYMNYDITDIVKGSYDLSQIVINIEGIAYDFFGNLWVWDGVWATPLKPYYNGYILDPVSRVIYMTDNWDQVIYT